MTDIQIVGLIVAMVSMVCGTAIIIVSIFTKRNNQLRAEQLDKERRQSAWNKTFESESLALYENERQMRIAAETREGIYRNQLARERKEVERLKTLVSVLEGRC